VLVVVVRFQPMLRGDALKWKEPRPRQIVKREAEFISAVSAARQTDAAPNGGKHGWVARWKRRHRCNNRFAPDFSFTLRLLVSEGFSPTPSKQNPRRFRRGFAD